MCDLKWHVLKHVTCMRRAFVFGAQAHCTNQCFGSADFVSLSHLPAHTDVSV